MKLSAYLFDQLHGRGVRHVFGLPGDYALNLFDALQADGRFELVRLSHEPGVGFAADGAARASGGIAVCCVTYGAGGLNMVNPVACAYAEESPLVVLSGAPGRAERRPGLHVHHEVKTLESQLNVYREVTEYAAVLDDPKSAAHHILRALQTAEGLKRPVYLEIPRDMVAAPIEAPSDESAVGLEADRGAVEEAVAEIASRLRSASNPVLIVGVEVHRFNLRDQVMRLAEALAVPVASSFLGRGVFPSRHPQFVGTYLGLVSPPSLRDIVESSDCVLLLGERISDTSLGVSAERLDERNLILCLSRDVFVGHHRYQETPLTSVLSRLGEMSWQRRQPRWVMPTAATAPAGTAGDRERTVRMVDVIEALNEIFDKHPEAPLVADTGDCLFASVEIRSNECMAPAYYATMGFAVPAALGLQVVSGRRPLVLVGDGAFQMTGAELAHAAELACNPVVVVLNNSSWQMLQAFVPAARYNATVSWPYARVAELWGASGFEVRTPDELKAAISAAWAGERPAVVEVLLERGDVSPVLARFVEAFKQHLGAGRPPS